MKLRGVLINRETRKVKVIRLKEYATNTGTFLKTWPFGKRQWLAKPDLGFIRDYHVRRPAMWFFLREGHASVLKVDDEIIGGSNVYTDATLDGAIASRIADRVLHGGMRLEYIIMAFMGIGIVILALR